MVTSLRAVTPLLRPIVQCTKNSRTTTIITGRNEVVAKVIFLHLFVILFTGGACLRQTPPPEQTPLEQTPPPQSRPPPGSGPPPSPLEQTPRSRHPPWEQTTPPGADHPPSPPKQTPAYGQRAAGRHPTGMHSCLIKIFTNFQTK